MLTLFVQKYPNTIKYSTDVKLGSKVIWKFHKILKLLKTIAQCPVSLFWIKTLAMEVKNYAKVDIKFFLVMPSFAWFFYFAPNILIWIVDNPRISRPVNNFLLLFVTGNLDKFATMAWCLCSCLDNIVER